ncbi:MAG TPA: histidine kinase dimerization/phosphoacceptor domain -containing protein [Syntrophorhabdales bacterium]|nr:histidine kinase dimerization/phosphoacceptor domain -containing protein [Syntrophorhabdales bacterium]
MKKGRRPVREHREPKWPEDKKIYAGFGAALIVLLLACVSSYWTTIRVIDNANWAIHSHEIVQEIADINFRLYVAESSQRTALITGRSDNSDQYQQAIEAIRRDLKELRKLTETSPVQSRRVDQLDLLLSKRLALVKEWGNLQRAKGFDAAMDVIMRDEGKKISDDITSVIQTIEKEERDVLRKRADTAETGGRTVSFVISFGYLLIFVLFVVAAYMIQSDLGERNRMEEMLRQSQREVSTLLDSLPAYVFFKDSKSVYMTANKKFSDAVGFSKREIVRKTDYDFYSRDKAIKLRADDARVLMTGEPMYVGEETLVESGRTVTVATRKMPLKNERGSVVGLIGVGFDVTEIKQGQKALRESEERFRNVFTQSPIGIQLYDLGYRLIEMNDSCMHILGVDSLEEARKFKLFEEPLMAEEIKERIENRETVRFEAQFDFTALKEKTLMETERSGNCYLDCVVAPLGGEDDEDQRLLVLLQDVTERRVAEERIRLSLKEKEVLLKEVHHRVKNNLQIISSLLNLQSKYIKDDQALEMFKESRNRIRSMTLIHEKLYRSKDLANIDVAEYIQNLSSNLFRSYSAGRISLKTQVDDMLLGIDTAIPCGLIINELVSNSLKHAFPEKQGEIFVNLHRDNGRFTLVVSDNGVGFPESVDFRNTDSLGLQLVCTLTDQLDGAIELNRKGGTEFKITFGEIKYKERA